MSQGVVQKDCLPKTAWPPDFEEERAERFEKMKRSICAAAILGAKYWVIHPIMPFGTKDLESGHAEQTRDINLEFMSRLLREAKREGVTICLENMPFLRFSLSSPTSIATFVKEIDDSSFAMCLDTGHANVCSDWLTPAQSMREYGSHIKVLHVHDNHGSDEHLLPFCGTINWKDFSAALHESGFDGAVSLECAPNANLPEDALRDMYSAYFKTAKAVYNCEKGEK